MTDRYAVIGNPIAHSQSPALHIAFAAQTGQDLRYGALEAAPDGFAAAARAFRAAGGRGMNVSTPLKLDAFAFHRAPPPGRRQLGRQFHQRHGRVDAGRLGIAGAMMHTLQEHIFVGSLVPRARLLAGLLLQCRPGIGRV